MDFSNVLSIVFGLVATVLGVLLKAEYDKRMALQQQVAEHKRKAYSKLNEIWNDVLRSAKDKNSTQNIERYARQLMELRHEIWQFGSDDVVKAYSVWSQCSFSNDDEKKYALLIFMADLIVKMRIDMGLSKKNSLTSLDILRIFVTDIESKYDTYAQEAVAFRNKLNSQRHITL